MKERISPCVLTIALISAVSVPTLANAAGGVAKGEASDEKGQQGLGLQQQGQSSNVITGGPDIVEGKIRVSTANNILSRAIVAKTSRFA